MKIFTVIVTYNGMRWLKRCLDSLRLSSVPTIPVVVDNNSSDESVDFIKENYPEVIVFQRDKNLGFGQANNIGIKYALENGADFVMLLNQDASIDRDALKYMLDASDGVSLLSPIHLNGDGKNIDNNFKKSLIEADNTFFDDLIIGKLKPFYEVREVCAACWFLPVLVIRRIGGFNPLFFHYGEDKNYSQRLRFNKIKTLVIPEAKMFHDRAQFGNKEVFYKNWVFREILVIAADINLSGKARFGRYLRMLRDCYLSDTWKKNYIPGTFVITRVKLMLRCGKIRASRRQDEIEGVNWL